VWAARIACNPGGVSRKRIRRYVLYVDRYRRTFRLPLALVELRSTQIASNLGRPVFHDG
jgi:hypothetical protein